MAKIKKKMKENIVKTKKKIMRMKILRKSLTQKKKKNSRIMKKKNNNNNNTVYLKSSLKIRLNVEGKKKNNVFTRKIKLRIFVNL
jgi:hypothetical protein